MKTEWKCVGALLCVLATSSPALAGKERGGGNARVCFSNPAAARAARLHPEKRSAYWSAIQSIEILDLFEARRPRGMTAWTPSVVEPKKNESPRDYISRIAQRFEAPIPRFASLIEDGAKSFSEDHIVWSEEPLPKVNDAKPTVSAETSLCSLITMALQDDQDGVDRLFIDRDLFMHPKHSALSRNVTFLHEAIYLRTRAGGNEDSRTARDAVGMAIIQVDSEHASQADELGLSNQKVLNNLEAMAVVMPNQGNPCDGLFGSLKCAMDQDDAIRIIQNAVSDLPAAKSFRDQIKHIVIDLGKFDVSQDDNRWTFKSCQMEQSDTLRDLRACLKVTSPNSVASFVSDPQLQKQLIDIGTRIESFLKTDANQQLPNDTIAKVLSSYRTTLFLLGMNESQWSDYAPLLKEYIRTSILSNIDQSDYKWQTWHRTAFIESPEVINLLEFKWAAQPVPVSL